MIFGVRLSENLAIDLTFLIIKKKIKKMKQRFFREKFQTNPCILLMTVVHNEFKFQSTLNHNVNTRPHVINRHLFNTRRKGFSNTPTHSRNCYSPCDGRVVTRCRMHCCPEGTDTGDALSGLIAQHQSYQLITAWR